MQHMTRLWKSLVWGTLAGGYRLSRHVSPARNAQEIAVLMYHSISQTDNYYAVAPHMFAQHMRYLKVQYCPVRLLEVAEFSQGKTQCRTVLLQQRLMMAMLILLRTSSPSFVCGGNIEASYSDPWGGPL
jgi:hypothetical protein